MMSLSDFSSLTSESICNLIVFYRLFSKNNESIESLMNELSKRRMNGDDFKFEERLKELDEEFKKINSQIIFSEDSIE